MVSRQQFSTTGIPVQVRLLLNHIYEYKKGIRPMVLYTLNSAFEWFAIDRLKRQKIAYHIQYVSADKINLFFGEEACIRVIKSMIDRPLNELNPEQDFILGALLGYNLPEQCRRYSTRKRRVRSLTGLFQ